MAETSAASIWARIFGIAAERQGVADDLLWPIAISEGMLELVDVVRDAVTFIAATFSHRSATEKAGFEAELLARVGSATRMSVESGRTAQRAFSRCCLSNPLKAARSKVFAVNWSSKVC
jgi:hypothetical protein